MCCHGWVCVVSKVDYIIAGSGSKLDSEEAEYAWLSIDSLKPFREGDSLVAYNDDKHVGDPTLKACIAAAEQAVKAATDRAAAAATDAAEQEAKDAEDGDESQSDSDGGEMRKSLAALYVVARNVLCFRWEPSGQSCLLFSTMHGLAHLHGSVMYAMFVQEFQGHLRYSC